MSLTKNITYLKKWLTYMLIFPCYNEKIKIFVSNPVKFTILLILVLSLGVFRQLGKFIFIEQTGPFQIFGELIIVLITMDLVLLNSYKNTRKINKLFSYMDKLATIEAKEVKEMYILTKIKTSNIKDTTYDNVKLTCIIWNLCLIGGVITMCTLMAIHLPFGMAFLRIYEMVCLYYMESAIFWRNLLCNIMKTQLEDINIKLQHLDVKQINSHEVHTALDQLIIRHNLIVNWVDGFNDLLGRQTLLIKIYESFHVLVALDMYLTDFFTDCQVFSTGGIMLLVITFLVVVCIRNLKIG